MAAGERPAPLDPVPGWVAPTFTVLALLTVPWTAYLALTLPGHMQTRHYRGAWVGFDIGLVVLLVLTAYLAWRGQRHVGLTATATATTLAIDAWFDVTTSPPGGELFAAILTALFVEVPLALLCLWIALHVDRVVARRLRQLSRRAERAELRGIWGAVWGSRAVRIGARSAEAGVGAARTGTRVTESGVRVAEAGVRAAEAAGPSPEERRLVERPDGDPGPS